MTTQKYQDASNVLLAQARSELAAGDVRQASEKGWGAAAQMVKAVADRRELEPRNHVQLYEVVRQLGQETGDNKLHWLFLTANLLSINSSEGWLDADEVGECLDEVELLIGKLRPLLAA